MHRACLRLTSLSSERRPAESASIRTLLNKFPENVPAAIFVVVHTSPDGPGKLASVLDRATRLTVVTPEDGMVARHGHVYVAPPDYHLIIDGGARLSYPRPREHRFRPAVDPLFRTAGRALCPRTIGVALSGHMADGTHGLKIFLIKEAGGVAMVQDPDEAQAPSMPLNAMRRGGLDYVLPVEEMARVIMGLLMNERDRRARQSPRTTAAENGSAQLPSVPAPTPSERMTSKDCPLHSPAPTAAARCGKSRRSISCGTRCHVGHGRDESLRDGMDHKLEDTLWTALRAIEENIELRSRMKLDAMDQRLTAFSGSLDQEIAHMKQRAAALRRLLLDPREHASTRSRRARKRQSHG